MKLALMIFLASLALSLKAAAAPIEIVFWHSMAGEKGKLLANIVDGFNQAPENKGQAQVKMQFIGSYEDGLNKLRTALLAKQGPHVVQVADIGTKVMIDSEAIVPLQHFIDKDPDFPLALILPAIKRYYQIDGVFDSLPFATSNPILYYNADAFREAGLEKPPTTFAELEAAALKLTDKKTKRLGITWPLHSWFFEQFVAKQGATLIKPDNGRESGTLEANYTSEEAKRFVTLWARMVAAGSFANVGRGWDPAAQNFLAGRVAMLVNSTSDIFETVKQAPFRVATAPIPGISNKAGGTIIGGNSLWIMKDKPEAEQRVAYRFLKHMASRDVQKKWHTNTGYFPIRQDVIDQLKAEGFYDKYPVAWTAIEQLRASPDGPPTRGALMGVFPEAREHIATAIEEVLSGHASVDEALARAKAKTDFSLLRYGRGRN